MNKQIKKIFLLVISVALLITVLAGCGKYDFKAVSGGDASAEVLSNGNRVVRQGNNVYFINGTVAADADNKFGNVLKGAIMRGTVAADGTISDYKVIVPKNVLASHADAGFYIFGEYLYYMTPNNNKDKYGKLQSDFLDFYKVRIDGTDTKLIATIKGADLQYRFTENALVYLKDGTLYSINTASKNFASTTIDTEVTKLVLPYGEAYKPGQSLNISDYVIYAKAKAAEAEGSFNRIFVAKPDGSDKKEIIGENSFLPSGVSDNSKYKYTITLDKYKVVGDKLTLFYTKDSAVGGTNEKLGLFSYTFDSSFSFDYTKEKHISYTVPTKYIIYNESSVVITDVALIYASSNDAGKPNEPVNISGKDSKFSGEYLFMYDGYIYYYVSGTSARIDKFKLDVTGNISENAITVYSGQITTTGIKYDLIGDMFFFADPSDYTYTHYINLKGDKNANNMYDSKLIGTMIEADAEAKKKAEEEKNNK